MQYQRNLFKRQRVRHVLKLLRGCVAFENPLLCFTCQSQKWRSEPEHFTSFINNHYFHLQTILLTPVNLNFLEKKIFLDFFLYYSKRLADNLKSNSGFWNSGACVFSLCLLICFSFISFQLHVLSSKWSYIWINYTDLQSGNGRWCILMIMVGFKLRYSGDKT